ncbi:MAG: UdgX family uracil-DNA binding protein [candidate division NC10 bacterium]|nr:UdgX family uracil-DNA binding protein [candidate division NC10 bacterium]
MAALRAEALTCPRCHLAETRTQVVFGEGNGQVRIMVVGQGPGAVEDETGRPFVGPAGALLDRALAEAGLSRGQLWITNIVKCRATKTEKGRLVDRPPFAAEVKACRPWLEGEIDTVRPRIIVCLGTPAAQALIKKGFRMGEEHGQWHEGPSGVKFLATFHPAYVLRLKSVDEEAYQRTWRALVEDLRKVAAAMHEQA